MAATEEQLLLAELLEDRDLMTESVRLGQRELAVVAHAIMLLAHGTPAIDVRAYLGDERALLEAPFRDQIARVRARLLQ